MVGVFRALTLTRQVWFMYFQVESPENGTKNIFRDKQTTKKVPLMFQMLNSFWKGKNCVFGLSQQASKVQCMYLAFQNLKTSSEKCQEWSES